MPLDFTSTQKLPLNPSDARPSNGVATSSILRGWRPLAETGRRRTHRLVAWFDGLLADGAQARRGTAARSVEA